MIKKSLIILISLAICSCSSINQNPARNLDTPWQKRQMQLLEIKQWNMSGVIGISSPEQSSSAHFNWIQNENNYVIHLFGPLGMGNNILRGDQDQFTLTTSKGTQYSAKSPEILMQEQLGWEFPVRQLYYWVRGTPAPNGKFTIKYDQYHHIKQLSQAGWIIHFDTYQEINSLDLPRQINMTQAQYNVKIIISQWNNQTPTGRYEPPSQD